MAGPASRPVGGQHNTLIGSSVFLRLSDVASGLPPYKEQVLLSTMDREADAMGLSQRGAYDRVFNALRHALAQALAKGSKRLRRASPRGEGVRPCASAPQAIR